MIFYLANFRTPFSLMKLIINRLSFLLLFLCNANLLLAQNIPSRPSPPRLVNDFANIFDDSQQAELEKKLVRFEDSTSIQIAVIAIKSLEGYNVEEVAHGILRKWGVGGKKNNNGVVLLVAVDDKKVNIQTGYGMEGVLPDVICKRIITRDIVPAFKRQDYLQGVDAATTSIIQVSQNEYNDAGTRQGQESGIPVFLFIFMIIFMLFVFASIAKRRNGSTIVTRRGYTNWDGGGWWYGPGPGSMSNWDDNHRGGGGGGFDFGGFGGGDGGGGGASGDW